MASPYSTGGGGTHFEARVVASYLAAALTEAPARGVTGLYVVEVLTQRAAFGDPLDDVIVSGQFADGTRSKLHLQIKSDLAFTVSLRREPPCRNCGGSDAAQLSRLYERG